MSNLDGCFQGQKIEWPYSGDVGLLSRTGLSSEVDDIDDDVDGCQGSAGQRDDS